MTLEKETVSPEEATSVAEAVDVVIVDDDAQFVNNLVMFIFSDRIVDTYPSPEELLEQLTTYPKNTKFLLDNQFHNSALSGIDVAQHLHEQGYTQLYLLSGRTFAPGEVPEHITVIRKDDIDRLERLF